MTDVGVLPRVRENLRLLAGFVTLGVLAGIAAKAADESGWRWAADLGSFPALWVLAVALVGRSAPTMRAAAVRAAAFFGAMTVAYYAWAAWVLGFGWNRLLPVWLILSATATATATAIAATAAGAHWATRRAGRLPGAVLAAVAGIVLAGGGVRDAGDHPLQVVADVVVTLVLVLVMSRHGRTRFWAVALLPPMTALADLGLGVLADVL